MKGDRLPEVLLSEIFLRLPSKSINRFKCVSKVWLSILSDPDFMNARFKALFVNETQPWAIFSNHVIPNQHNPADLKIPSKLFHTQFISSCSGLSSYDGFSFNFLNQSYRFDPQSDLLHVIASSNGLVLCCVVNYPKETMRYFVCNPITEEFVSLPAPPDTSVGEFSYGLVSETYSLKSTFKVVETPFFIGTGNDIWVKIYFSELGEWRTYHVALPDPQQPSRRFFSERNSVITHRGVVYWFAEYRSDWIIAYDLNVNSYGCDRHYCNVLNVPREREGRHYYASSLCLGVSEDSVCYGQIFGNTLRIWELVENDNFVEDEETVWNLRHDIELPKFESTKISLIAFSPVDRDVVVLDCGDKILPYDVTTGKILVCNIYSAYVFQLSKILLKFSMGTLRLQ